jgi:hypothetical protein
MMDELRLVDKFRMMFDIDNGIIFENYFNTISDVAKEAVA